MTLEEIKEMRDAALQAYKDALQAQSMSFGGVNNRSVTYQDIKDLKAEFEAWDRRYNLASGKRTSKPFSLARFGRI